MPRAAIEIDALLAHQNHPVWEFRRIEEDDEWARTLSAQPRSTTTLETVFADLHDLLVNAQYPAAADTSEIEGRLATARTAVRDWACRALSGQAKVTLDACDCYMLFQLIRCVDQVLIAVIAPEFVEWLEATTDPIRRGTEPVSMRVAS